MERRQRALRFSGGEQLPLGRHAVVEAFNSIGNLRRSCWKTLDSTLRFYTYSRVPLSLLNPEAEIPIFCVASGVTANFSMVPKFEESARKSHRGLAKRLLPASSARNSGQRKVTDNGELGTLEYT
jgi:hypothetical protein